MISPVSRGHRTAARRGPDAVHGSGDTWDELIGPDGTPRRAAAMLLEHLEGLAPGEIADRQMRAELDILAQGITFTVYADGRGTDRAWSFDIIPRVIAASEWRRTTAGLVQRLDALNRFIDDVYGARRVVADGVFPAEMLDGAVNFRPECVGVRPRFGVWAHICGSDLVRDRDGTLYVLEDNLRIPSGASYLMVNRGVSKRAFGDVFARQSVLPVDDYPDRLFAMLTSLAPDRTATPNVVVLTPGVHNSAYFEHAFLARRMGVPLVEGRDLFVDRHDRVVMRTVGGDAPVDVIYRRVDDLFLDPEVFRPDSVLGVPGLMRAWRAGTVAIANAPGAGVADDKAVYAWVPDLIRYYLGEEPLIANVPTWRCMYDDEREFVRANVRELVLKPANESGGSGLLIGDRASDAQIAATLALVESDPRNWVAQPILGLSTVPTLTADGIRPRHVDLRPFILSGEHPYVTAGGLTRVALRPGSLVVNSSQGGGSKDTWVVEDAAA